MSIDNKLVKKIVDRQFEMIGSKLRYSTLPEDGLIKVGKKTLLWWNYWKFATMDQWIEWRTWADGILLDNGVENAEWEMNYIDLRWGMAYKVKKEEELF